MSLGPLCGLCTSPLVSAFVPEQAESRNWGGNHASPSWLCQAFLAVCGLEVPRAHSLYPDSDPSIMGSAGPGVPGAIILQVLQLANYT